MLYEFNETFFFFLRKLLTKENFAFVRFSDGELDILQNLYVELSADRVQRGSEYLSVPSYPVEDHKIFDPTQENHQKSRELLLEALQFCKKNYFKGLSCPCCVPHERVKQLWELHGDRDTEHIVWANQFVNSNYVYFLQHIYKVIKDRQDVILIGNESIDLPAVDLQVKEFFSVGYNCFVNDRNLIEQIKEYIVQHNINNHLFLFSAASLSEILIYELYKDFPHNTYIDIGTTLHKQLGLSISRDYLQAYWQREPHPDLHKRCVHPLMGLPGKGS